MNIRRAGRKVVKNLHKEYGIYRIGFVNIYGEEDETELDAMNINDLERLWLSLCPEFECKGRIDFGRPDGTASGISDSRFFHYDIDNYTEPVDGWAGASVATAE